MTTEIYIVVVTFNALDWLPVCCAPYRKLPPGWKLVVVDNASTDGTVRALRSMCPEALVIESPVNLGFGRANNKGLRLALEKGASHVLLLNQDAEISIEAIAALAAEQERQPEHLIVSPVHLDGTGENLDYGFADSCLPKNCARLVKDALDGHLDSLYTARTGTAAVWLLSRRCLESVGGFSPVFFHYGEDNNYVDRLRYHGFKLGIAPHVFARHHRRQRPKAKNLGRSYTDRIIRASDPAGPQPCAALLFLRAILQAACLFLNGKRAEASFILKNHAGFLNKPLLAARKASRQKGPLFLD